jgi:formylglycine-generating enzyme
MPNLKLKIVSVTITLFVFQAKAIAQADTEIGNVLAKSHVVIAMQPGTVFTDCANCPEMVVIPAGKFMMGSQDSEIGRQKHESPVHLVDIAKPYALGRFEITRGQFALFSNETRYKSDEGCWAIEGGKYTDSAIRNWHDTGYLQQDNHPAACISWIDARAYTEWLSKKTGKHYRLPSESEWEYAARGNTTSARYWGDSADQACRYANVMDSTGKTGVPNVQWGHNCTDGFAFTAPVGSKLPNPFGLYDMLGNVWEWTEDSYHDNYIGAPSDGSAWTIDGKNRVIRGGSWLNRGKHVRVAERATDEATDHDNFTGFRIVRMLQD